MSLRRWLQPTNRRLLVRLVRSATEVLARIYDVELPARQWVESVRDASVSCFDGIMDAQAYLFKVGPEGSFQCHEMASDPEMRRSFDEAHALAAPALIRKLYQSCPVVRLPQVVLGGHEKDAGYRAVVETGKNHVTVVLGVDPSGLGCALTFVEERSTPLTRQTRRTLERIAAHLGSARRLRGSVGSASVVDGADAVLSADGSVLHAVGEARALEARHALREAARRVDRARIASTGSAPDEALGLWRALVDGRWSLVERFDTDGRRMFVARRNDPSVRPSDELSERERKVIALLALGHSMKLCAYELGFPQSSVSELARSAMRKMGVRSRAELVELHGAIIAAEKRS